MGMWCNQGLWPLSSIQKLPEEMTLRPRSGGWVGESRRKEVLDPEGHQAWAVGHAWRRRMLGRHRGGVWLLPDGTMSLEQWAGSPGQMCLDSGVQAAPREPRGEAKFSQEDLLGLGRSWCSSRLGGSQSPESKEAQGTSAGDITTPGMSAGMIVIKHLHPLPEGKLKVLNLFGKGQAGGAANSSQKRSTVPCCLCPDHVRLLIVYQALITFL